MSTFYTSPGFALGPNHWLGSDGWQGSSPPPSPAGDRATLYELALGINPNSAPGTPTAFPDARGYAAQTCEGALHGLTGSQTATAYLVTNGNDSGSGSFRAAAETPGNRVIVILHSGPIDLLSTVTISSGNVSIRNIGGAYLRWWDAAGTINSFGPPIAIDGAAHVAIDQLKSYRGIHPDAISTMYSQGGESGGDAILVTGGSTDVFLRHCAGLYGIDQTLLVASGSRRVGSMGSIFGRALHYAWHTKTINEGTEHGFGLQVFHAAGYSAFRDYWTMVSYRGPQTNTYDLSVDLVGCGFYNGPPQFGTIKASNNGDKTARVNAIGCMRESGPAVAMSAADAWRTRTDNSGTGEEAILHGSANAGDGASANSSNEIDAGGGMTTTWSATKLGSIPYDQITAAAAKTWILEHGGPGLVYHPTTEAVLSLRDSVLTEMAREWEQDDGPARLLDDVDVVWPTASGITITEADFKTAAEAFFASDLGLPAAWANAGDPVTLQRDDNGADVSRIALDWFVDSLVVDSQNYSPA